MKLWRFGRAYVLALFLWVCSLSTTFAHALPGSVLTFSLDGTALDLRIELALEDLIAAAPEFEPLSKAPVDQPVPENMQARLDAYFAKHLKVATSDALPLHMDSASLQLAQNDHVGTFTLLTIGMRAETGEMTPPTLTLDYDAVMHEVRNHRATIYWDGPDSEPIRLIEFGFHGRPHPAILELP